MRLSSLLFLLVLLGPLFMSTVRADEQEDKESGIRIELTDKAVVPVDEILKQLGAQLSEPVIPGRHVSSVKVRVSSPGVFNLEGVISLLSAHGVELIWEDTGSELQVRALLKRDVAQEIANPSRVLKVGDPIPEKRMLVAVPYRLKYADGNGVFAAIRGLMSRDSLRVGNIVYVRRNETLILSDLTPRLRSYLQMIEELDHPPAEKQTRVTVLRVSRKRAGEIGPDIGPGKAAGLRDRLLERGEATTVLDATVTLTEGADSRAGDLSLQLTEGNVLALTWKEGEQTIRSTLPAKSGRTALATRVETSGGDRTTLIFVTVW